MLTQEILQQHLHYNPETGIFIRLQHYQSRFIGKIAGDPDEKGYLRIGLFGKSYKAHRLAFLYMTGVFPEHQCDHINGVKSDNRWENLRPATNAQNCRNRGLRANNTSGYPGVTWSKSNKKWQVSVSVDGKRYHTGYFKLKKDAVTARLLSADALHKEFSSMGRIII